MAKYKNKSVIRIVLSSLTGLLLFLILLVAANYFIKFTDNSIFHLVVQFLNNNIVLIVLISLVFLIAEIFGALIFPFNLPAPLFNAIGSVFLVAFIFRIFELADLITKENIFDVFIGLSPLIYPLVFITVLVIGYVLIFARLFERDENETEIIKEKKLSDKKTWEDVGDEFRQMIYDILSLIREAVNKRRER